MLNSLAETLEEQVHYNTVACCTVRLLDTSRVNTLLGGCASLKSLFLLRRALVHQNA